MIALPFHPANVYEIDTLNQNLPDILREVEIESEKEKFDVYFVASSLWVKVEGDILTKLWNKMLDIKNMSKNFFNIIFNDHHFIHTKICLQIDMSFKINSGIV